MARTLCRSCGTPILPASRFCESCGEAQDPPVSERGRRQLTLLFCDLEGGGELAERLDPEEWQDLLNSYHGVVTKAIDRYEGHRPQLTGDGVMSHFGYPRAHEDDAVRAVSAALAILEGLKSVNSTSASHLHAELRIRIGIDSGLAVVGSVEPGGAHDGQPIGQTPNLAARIQALAEPSTVLLSAATARLVEGHFELQRIGTRILPGFTKAVELFRVERPTGARTKFEAALRGKLTPFVGRRSELARLQTIWQEVQEGAARVVVVRGEAGIGKSRILHQFRREVLGEQARVEACFCSPATEGTALAPLIELISVRVLELAENTSPEAKLAVLGRLLEEGETPAADALPLLAALLSIPCADEAALEGLSPMRRRVRTFEAMRSWLASSAHAMPLALLVEDLHWADPSTLEFLDHFVQQSPADRSLLCVTARPESLQRWSQEHVRTIKLDRLTTAEIEVLVTHVADGHALPPAVQRGVAERSEGVPLYVEEVTKAVLESGALRLDEDRYQLTGEYEDRIVPSTVQGSLVARFDRLGESRPIAQLAAAIGREFSYSQIRAVADIPDAELELHLDALSRSEMAFARGVPPHADYTFKHALIQKAIYETLLKRERARVHESIFRALEEKLPEIVAARPELAAHHAEQAGLNEAAVPLLLEAGLMAAGRTALVEAVRHLERGMALVKTLEASRQAPLELELQAALGPAHMATKGWAAPPVEQSCARLRELAAASGDGRRLYQAMWGLWTVHFLRGELEQALEVAGGVYDMAENARDPLLQVTGHHAIGYTHFYRGDYQQALHHAREGLALFDLERERAIASIFQFSSTLALRCFSSEALQMLGRFDEAEESLRQWRALIDELRHAPSRAYSLAQMCFFFHARYDAAEVRRLAAELRSLSIDEGFALWVPIADVHLAWAGAYLGDDANAAVSRILEAKAQIDQSLTHITELELVCELAETLLLAGRPEEVAPAIDAALAQAQRGRLGHFQPELLRLQGEAFSVMGDAERAKNWYRQALDAADRMGARALAERARSALGRARR